MDRGSLIRVIIMRGMTLHPRMHLRFDPLSHRARTVPMPWNSASHRRRKAKLIYAAVVWLSLEWYWYRS